MLQSITEFSCLIYKMLQNTVAEKAECYEMIQKLI